MPMVPEVYEAGGDYVRLGEASTFIPSWNPPVVAGSGDRLSNPLRAAESPLGMHINPKSPIASPFPPKTKSSCLHS